MVTTASVLLYKFLISTCVCFNTRPDWSTAKGILGDAKFLSKLMEYDKVGTKRAETERNKSV